jgi:hypothetical protein
VAENRQRLGLAVFTLEALLVLHALRVGAQEEDRSFGEGPLELVRDCREPRVVGCGEETVPVAGERECEEAR